MKGFFACLALFWATVSSALACQTQAFEGATFTVCRYDPSTDDLGIAWRTPSGAPLLGLQGLKLMMGPRWGQVRFATNAGMFHLGGRPVGLFVRNGVREVALNRNPGPGNFHLLPNGVFWVDTQGYAHVEATERFARRRAKPLWATQSGPMLVIGGRLHPDIQEDGPSRLIRNGVGATQDGAALFAISETPVSFGKMARFYRDALGSRDALYLDGSVSSLAIPATNRMDLRAPLGPILWVSTKP